MDTRILFYHWSSVVRGSVLRTEYSLKKHPEYAVRWREGEENRHCLEPKKWCRWWSCEWGRWSIDICDQEGWREKGREVDTKVMMQDDSKDVHVLPKNDTTASDWFNYLIKLNIIPNTGNSSFVPICWIVEISVWEPSLGYRSTFIA